MNVSVIIARLEGCPPALLDDPVALRGILGAAVQAGGFTLLHDYVHKFSPQGVTAAAVLAESHIAIHSWPEHGSLFVDLATCSGPERTAQAFARICAMVPHAHVVTRTVDTLDNSTQTL